MAIDQGSIVHVLVDRRDGFYARIESLRPSSPGWFEVYLLVFSFPLQSFCWNLDQAQIDGAEFVMGDTLVQLVVVAQGHGRIINRDRASSVVVQKRTPAKVISINSKRM
jgi:hypothetical protein